MGRALVGAGRGHQQAPALRLPAALRSGLRPGCGADRWPAGQPSVPHDELLGRGAARGAERMSCCLVTVHVPGGLPVAIAGIVIL